MVLHPLNLTLQMALVIVPEKAEDMTLNVVVFGHPELRVTHSDPPRGQLVGRQSDVTNDNLNTIICSGVWSIDSNQQGRGKGE